MAKYDSLRDWLERAPRPAEMSFAQIDMLVGGLPHSAYVHRAWWANERTGRHVQAQAWLEAGRTVADVDLHAGRVRFR
jgi:hypothetical protein